MGIAKYGTKNMKMTETLQYKKLCTQKTKYKIELADPPGDSKKIIRANNILFCWYLVA